MASSQELIQIEQIDKGLNSLNTTINNTSASYLKLVKNIADNTVAIKEQAITFDGLAKAQKTTTDNAKQLDSLGKQLAATEAKLKDLEDSRTATIIKNKLANQEATKELTLKIKAQQAERGSTEQLIAVNAILEQRLKSVNQTTEEGRKKADLLRGAIDRNNVTIKDNSSALTAQKINIGNYGSALDGLKGKFTALGNSASNLPGPLGMASKGLIAVGKEMWALVANPIGALIAGIVIVFTSLYSIFTSTASGGKLVKEVMASISAIFDVLKQRATVLIDAFGALFSGDFSRAADLFSQSVSGIGKQMEDAAKEAWSLVDAQSALNKELAFHVSEASKEVNAIQKALFAAKDKTKSDRERLDNLNSVLKLSKEQSEKEVEYAKRQYIIDTDKAALKAKVSGVTGDQLRAFIELDAVEQMQSLKTSESLKKMYDLIGGSDNFKPLEESYAKVTDADTKFFESNKRTASQQSTILNEMAADKADAAKKILEDQEKQAKKAMEIDIEVAKSKSDSINEILKNAEDAIKVQEQLEKELMTLGEDDLKAYMDNEDKKTEKAKEEADKKLEIAKELKDKQLEIAAEAINGIFDLGSMKRDEELSALDKEREKKLSNENLTAKQKEKINEEFDKKAAAIKTKQAKADKLQAMFNIALNTAKGIMEATASLMLPLIPWVIGMGALQLGLVAARPIPKFAKGTSNAPNKGIFGESGRELMFLRSGEVAIANQTTYFEGSKFKGAQIKSNLETEKILSMTGHNGFSGRTMTDERIIKGLNSVERAILNKPVQIVDKQNRTIGMATSHHQEIYLNRLMRNN